ncbi:hypothetical protein [Microseira wollei]|uniref:Uncharacterized protein n=1 Tax=Microseira wollei NIES-4236 TaxID=2530354 RepID=A0AAV3XRD3_9CYAN|nr:hypothetical protein [Microseira wollei]GET44221.1 hypothetical protein MiSe_90470 [Microseira wollei NIES-4236]
MIQIPEKFAVLIADLSKQLEEFEKTYGYIPKCQLVVSEEYQRLVKEITRKESR